MSELDQVNKDNQQALDEIDLGNASIKEATDAVGNVSKSLKTSADLTEKNVREALDKAKELGRTARNTVEHNSVKTAEVIRNLEETLQQVNQKAEADREKIDAAAQRAGKVIDVLLEVNTSKEEAKSGFQSTEELFECLGESALMKNVRVRGLMTVGPVDCDPALKDELTDEAFKELVRLREECRNRFPDLDFSVLSMGMSGDYMIGVKNGSTEVRIGTAIFGPRDYGQK